MTTDGVTLPRPGRRAGGLPTQFGYKPTLDGLRAVAVLSVIAFHFGTGQLPGGFLGVDTFFVLSGYLITSLLLVEWGRIARINFPAFWARRARRLLPALFVVLIAIAIWAALAVSTDQLNGIRSDGLWTLFYAANWHFIHSGQSYFALVTDASPLRHAWSLAIEEQFYLVWPLLTFLCLRLARGRTRVLTGLCVGGAIASATAMGLLYTSADPSRAYYGTDTRAQGLLIGALTAIFLARRAGRPLPRWVQLVGFAGVAVCVAMFAAAHDSSAWMYPWGFVLFELSTAAVIVGMTQPVRTPIHALLTLRPVRWVGQISYGLYLWHWPVSIAISSGHTRLTGWSLCGARLAVTFAAATASYYLIELPIRHRTFLKGWGSRVAAPLGFAAVATVLVVGTAGATAPPRYLVASPNQVLKTKSSHPIPATPQATTPGAPTVPGPVLLVGDSVADTLSKSLSDTAATHGVQLTSAVRPGCGLLTGTPVAPDGTMIAWGKACSDATPQYESDVARSSGARVVVALSTWENADRIVDGHLVKLGTPEATTVWFRLLDEARARLTAATGARLLLVKIPPPATFSDLGPASQDAVHRMLELNDVYVRYAAARPGVKVVDLAAIVCPKGPPCPEVLDGIRLRPRDGGHYDPAGAAWVAPRLYAAIVAATA